MASEKESFQVDLREQATKMATPAVDALCGLLEPSLPTERYEQMTDILMTAITDPSADQDTQAKTFAKGIDMLDIVATRALITHEQEKDIEKYDFVSRVKRALSVLALRQKLDGFQKAYPTEFAVIPRKFYTFQLSEAFKAVYDTTVLMQGPEKLQQMHAQMKQLTHQKVANTESWPVVHTAVTPPTPIR